MSQGKLKLSYLPDGAQLVAGDEVVTSGKGDVFPSGLVVGTVEAVFTDPSGHEPLRGGGARCGPGQPGGSLCHQEL